MPPTKFSNLNILTMLSFLFKTKLCPNPSLVSNNTHTYMIYFSNEPTSENETYVKPSYRQ